MIHLERNREFSIPFARFIFIVCIILITTYFGIDHFAMAQYSTSTLNTSALPNEGTYNAAQQVMLIASTTPSTIFYTTDGTTPTTSSSGGSSPLPLVISSNSTLKFFAKDIFGNTSPINTARYVIFIPVTVWMNDTSSSTGFSTYGEKPIRAEFVSSNSALAGKAIDTITVNLKKTGLPSGPVIVGVFNRDLTVKQLFGTMNSSDLTTNFATYSFSLAPTRNYIVQPGDRIGIKFVGGTSTNNVVIMVDSTNSFDGTHSEFSSYVTSWQYIFTDDLSMSLSLHLYGTGPIVSVSPPSGTYNSVQQITLAASRTPSTIFYTTDGAAPTTSSTHGASPITLPINTNSTLKFFARDSYGNVSPISYSKYAIFIPSITQMNDSVSSAGFTTYNEKQISGEYIPVRSQLVNMEIDTISVSLSKMGLPSGLVLVGVFNNDTSVKHLFGTIDSSALTTNFKKYSFSLAPMQNYTIHAGDVIGIKFVGGTLANNIFIMVDLTNSFDTSDTIFSYYHNSMWNHVSDYDLTMVLLLHLYHVQQPHKILMFADWPSPSDAPQVHSLMHQHLKPAICFHCIRSGDWIQDELQFSLFSGVIRSVLEPSIPQIQNATVVYANGPGINAITYDPEKWSLTPDSEKANLTTATIKASNIVHAAGYKFGWAGQAIYLRTHYKAINWKNVDVLIMQDPGSLRLATFKTVISPIIQKVRSDNPNIIILMQLSLRWMNDPLFPDVVKQFDAEVDTSLANGVNGIVVVYVVPSEENHHAFTIPNLKRMLSYLASVGVGS